MEKNAKIYIAGHTGMVGSAILRKLKASGYSNIICKTHAELDLTRQADVEKFFSEEKPEYVFLAAAKVGGIGAMVSYPAEFLNDNLQIQNNILCCSHYGSVKKLIFISSTVVYPVDSQQPIKENTLLTGKLDSSSESYAIAKIAGIKQCSMYKKEYGDNFISVIPANIYGYNGLFDIKRSHVIPAMIRRFHSAKIHRLENVIIWGTGNACRELIFADDVADGCIFLMNKDVDDDYYNLGVNKDYSMLEIANQVKKVVGFTGNILTDSSKPEGATKRLLDSSKINQLGWVAQTSLENGLHLTYQWFLENVKDKDELYI